MYKLRVVKSQRVRIVAEDSEILEITAEIFTEVETGIQEVVHTIIRAYPLDFSYKQMQAALKLELDGWVRDHDVEIREAKKQKIDSKINKTIEKVQDLVIE